MQPIVEREPCHHPVQLGDGRTKVICTEMVTLDVALYASDGTLQEPISTVFHILPHLGDRMIIGLPDILGNYYDIFTTILEEARLRRPKARIERLAQLYVVVTLSDPDLHAAPFEMCSESNHLAMASGQTQK